MKERSRDAHFAKGGESKEKALGSPMRSPSAAGAQSASPALFFPMMDGYKRGLGGSAPQDLSPCQLPFPQPCMGDLIPHDLHPGHKRDGDQAACADTGGGGEGGGSWRIDGHLATLPELINSLPNGEMGLNIALRGCTSGRRCRRESAQ